MIKHFCKAVGCCVKTSPREHFCQRHYWLLPAAIKTRIKETGKDPTKATDYRVALLDAVDAIAALESCQPKQLSTDVQHSTLNTL